MSEKSIYLELVHENHHKFYQLIESNQSIIINYGRIGRAGRLKLINFASVFEAELFFNKQIQTKVKKGYKKSIKGLTLPKLKNIHPRQLKIMWLK